MICMIFCRKNLALTSKNRKYMIAQCILCRSDIYYFLKAEKAYDAQYLIPNEKGRNKPAQKLKRTNEKKCVFFPRGEVALLASY